MWQAADAVRLKYLREQSGIEVNQFARLMCISATQIRQLEGEGESAFYSPLIKYQVGKKILNLFGDSPASEMGSARADELNTQDEDPTKASTTKLSEKEKAVASLEKNAEVSNRQYNPPAHIAIASSISFCWKEHIVFSRLIVLFFVVLIGNYFLKAPMIAMSEKLWSKDSKVIVEASESRLEIKPVEPVVESASKSDPSASSSKPLISSEPSERPVQTTDCIWAQTPFILKSPKPIKSAEYVYLVALKDVTTCVTDQSKQAITHSLKAGQTQTVNGKAPFRVYSEKMSDLMIFYQGYRVVVPSKETDVLLIETPMKP